MFLGVFPGLIFEIDFEYVKTLFFKLSLEVKR